MPLPNLFVWNNNCGVFFSFLVARLSMKHVRILQLDEDVLCVRYSPNQKLLAVSLLDCTVKIFYVDTLKVHDQTGCEAGQGYDVIVA